MNKVHGRLARLACGLLACGLTLSLTGCMWARLLALKRQLADFDRYVKVQTTNGLAFQFLKPVLRADDVRALLEADPTSKATNQDQQTWTWTFAKVAPTNEPAGDFDLEFSTSFKQGMLTKVAISDRFRTIMPDEVVLAMARSLGHAKVDQTKREMTSNWHENDPKHKVAALSRSQVVELLGAPLSVSDSEGAPVCRYEYKLKSPSLRPGQTRRARLRFLFARDTDQLARLEVMYSGLRVVLSFEVPEVGDAGKTRRRT